MDSLFSAITGQFGKIWILGSLLPSLAAVILWEIFVEPLLLAKGLFLQFPVLPVQLNDVLGSLFAAVIISGLLYNLNNTLIRWYEGYYWEYTLIGKWRKDVYQRKMRADLARFSGMRTFAREADKKDYEDAFADDVEHALDARIIFGASINHAYPDRDDLILPTRLGNIIRSAERYSSVQYNLDAIALWPRLIGVMEKEYASAMDESKLSVDFTLNSSFLSLCLAVIILFAGFTLPPYTIQNAYTVLYWLLSTFLFLGLSRLFYIFSLENASVWGDMIRGAFDLYRFDLLKKLGYSHLPNSRAEEAQLWSFLSQEALYGPDLKYPQNAYSHLAAPVFSVEMVPPDSSVKLSRGIALGAGSQPGQVSIYMQNQGDGDITSLVVIDTVEDGLIYVQGSARSNLAMVEVEGSNPYRFNIPCGLKGMEKRELRYQVAAWPKNGSDQKEAQHAK